MFKIIKSFKAKEWGLVLCSLVFIITSVWAELTMPEYMSEITKLVQTAGSEMSEILIAGAKNCWRKRDFIRNSITVSSTDSRYRNG